MTAAALSLTLTLGAAPAVLACGDDHKEAAKTVPADAQTLTLKVVGMTCGGCANEIRNALLKLAGVYDADINWETGVANVKVDGKQADEAKVSEAIVKAGFKVEKPKG